MTIRHVGLTTGDFANSLKDLPSCLNAFEAFGLDSVELTLAAFEVVVGGSVNKARLAELQRVCARRPFRFTCHAPVSGDLMDLDHLPLQEAVLAACIDVAGAVGANVLVCHAGGAPTASLGGGGGLARRLEAERNALARLAPRAADAGVLLCLENVFSEPGIQRALPSELAEQIRAIDHPSVAATIDFSHAALNAAFRGADLMSELAALAPLAGHLHIHDSFGRPQTFRPYTRGDAVMFGLGDLHLPPGWGVLDWDAIARLPYARPVIANLELTTRYRAELPEAVGLCRWMAALSGETA